MAYSAMMQKIELTQSYRGYTICGAATPVDNYVPRYFAEGKVLLLRPDQVLLEVFRFYDRLLTYDDPDLARCFGIFLAELAVDHCVPRPWYYLRPMDFAWAVDILRRSAVECMEREIRLAKLYEALDFLEREFGEKQKQKWLVRRYRNALRGDRRNWREQRELRNELRVATRGIQQACVALLVERMNELARHYRENKAEIENLRWELSVVRKPLLYYLRSAH
jgi:hypothetical protein